ncbi:MAG: hypothetical protein GY820_24115 [Gammaproteobacteria bacterium]|nr:hypothetical protein [Gammaproteobacteria bacterium]
MTNNRGNQLEQVLNDHNLNIENTSLESTWKARGSSTTIDLTITNSFAPEISNWQVIQDASESDHAYIQYNIEMSTSTRKHKKTKTIDWNRFITSIKEQKQKDTSNTSVRPRF